MVEEDVCLQTNTLNSLIMKICYLSLYLEIITHFSIGIQMQFMYG